MKLSVNFLFAMVMLCHFSWGLQRPVQLEGIAQGTSYSIDARMPRWVPEHWTRTQVEAIFDRIDRQVSTYRSDSEISQFNQYGHLRSIPISADFEAMLRFGMWLYRQSGGYWDGTVHSLNAQTPVAKIGMDQLRLSHHRLSKSDPHLKLSLNSGAQGYAIDQIVIMLKCLGATEIKVELGGEVRVYSSQNKVYRIGLAQPYTRYHRILGEVSLCNGAISTSGSDGKGAHIRDPHTGKKVKPPYVAICVIAPCAMWSDALATTIFAMPVSKRAAFLRKFPHIRVIEVYQNRILFY